ncbi:TonB-dependent receptor [Permianibacter aggregans]|uniref:Iron complex outermembrane receptor protein n=1 Tax=Permianibacter aggregans TaxID=1510150 RepID=A0A4R6UGX5_9GAMM|nr:TonB-dependent receptor [Permianibacter aggregans]QGX38457.1 TonB-dependent receptor [Permianibacter aggregans]TDQ45572.1 iron complex outermembrane receptor protein [Permianibacter aggregans]
MYPFKRSVISLALASALSAGTYAQAAEDATAEQAEAGQEVAQQKDSAKKKEAVVITVTGLRASIERATETKFASDTITEVISAEDIGKLPDMSIADAISRLPGVTAQRTAGRASQINIRGMPDYFSTTLVNGREQVSVSQTRGAEFDQYPSELISSVMLYKTPDATLVGQGLSGTVDLRTAMPLDYNERIINVNIRGEKNSKGELNPEFSDIGERFSISYIDQFMDGKVGLTLGYAHLGSVNQSNRWEAWGYPTADVNSDGTEDIILGGGKVQSSSGEFIRDGFIGVLELKPNDNFRSTVDLFYSEFESNEVLRFMETGLAWSGASLQDPVVDANNIVQEATFVGVRPVLRNDVNRWDDEMLSVGWKNEFSFGDAWEMTLDLSHSEAERKQLVLETYSGLGHASNSSASDTVRVLLDQGTGLARYQYGENYADPQSIVLTDPGGWNQDGFLKNLGTEDELDSLNLSFTHTFQTGWISQVEFGVNYTEREKSRSSDEYFVNLNSSFGDELVIPSDILLGAVDLGFAGNTNSIAYNPLAGLPSTIANNASGSIYTTTSLFHPDVSNKNWTVNEDVMTFFIQANIEADWGVPVRGNIGVQYVDTEQSSVGFNPNQNAQNPAVQTGGISYDELLPSLNLTFEVVDDQLLRVGLGRQLARPRLDDLRANQNVGICNTCGPDEVWSGGGGNPQLKPWLADAFDVTYEIYFGSRGYVAFNAFYKDLKTYIFDQNIDNYDYGFIDTSIYPPGTTLPDTFIGRFSGPANGEGGSLSGFEVAASLPLDVFSDMLEGFGIQANYSAVDSEIEAKGPGSKSPLPGLSEVVHNVTFYYEASGFSARISQRTREDFLAQVQGFGGDLSDRYIRGETITDFQMGYSFAEDSSLDGLSLLLQVNNLTDEPYREYFPDTSMPRFYAEFGTTYLLGASYRF